MEKEKLNNFKEKLSNLEIDGTVVLVLLVATLSLMDVYSHPYNGVADLERRKMLEGLIGSLADHIGNFSISSSLAITSVFIKNMFDEIFHSEIAKKIIKAGYTFSLSLILTLNALIESFPGNNEAIPDFLMGAFAVALSVPAAQGTINKFKRTQ